MDGDQFDPVTGEIAAPVVRAIPPAIAAAIIAIKKQVKQLGADDRNEHGRYNFVSVDKFYATIGKLMADAGLALLIDETSTEVRASDKSGNPWLFCRYDLAFIHEGGAMSHPMRRSCALPISGPQAFGAAQSYIEKQFLRQVFKVPTGEKDADDTPTDGVAPESRSGARTAQGSAGAARTGYQRQQAAPAASDEALETARLQRELRVDIDACVTVPALMSIFDPDKPESGNAKWQSLVALAYRGRPTAEGDALLDVLANRIAKRRDMIEGKEPEGGY